MLNLSRLNSFLKGKNDPKKMDPALFVPLVDNKMLPETIRKFFRFGVPEYEPEMDDVMEEDSIMLKDKSEA